MKNKKITYLLILGVAVVWSLIFYRIFLAMNEEEPVINQTTTAKAEYFKLIDHAQDPVLLALNYRNPFDGNQPDPVIVETKEVKAVKNTAPMPFKPQVNWSNISFQGYINNPATKKKIAILIVNGKEVLLSEGQDDSGVKLLKNAGDSVKVQYQNDSKYIRIK